MTDEPAPTTVRERLTAAAGQSAERLEHQITAVRVHVDGELVTATPSEAGVEDKQHLPAEQQRLAAIDHAALTRLVDELHSALQHLHGERAETAADRWAAARDRPHSARDRDASGRDRGFAAQDTRSATHLRRLANPDGGSPPAASNSTAHVPSPGHIRDGDG